MDLDIILQNVIPTNEGYHWFRSCEWNYREILAKTDHFIFDQILTLCQIFNFNGIQSCIKLEWHVWCVHTFFNCSGFDIYGCIQLCPAKHLLKIITDRKTLCCLGLHTVSFHLVKVVGQVIIKLWPLKKKDFFAVLRQTILKTIANRKTLQLDEIILKSPQSLWHLVWPL